MKPGDQDLVVRCALDQIGVKESKKNAGPKINLYLKSVGLMPGNPWCAAFASWVVTTALQRPLDITPSGSVHCLWRWARSKSNSPVVGAIWCVDHGNELGHCGIVVAAFGDKIITVEGNSNASGSREGDVVCLRCRDARPQNLLGYAVP